MAAKSTTRRTKARTKLRERPSASAVYIFAFWGVLFGIGAVYSDFKWMRAAVRQISAAGWPTVIGTVTRSQIEVADTDHSNRGDPSIAYSYVADDIERSGTRIQYGGVLVGRWTAAFCLDRFPVGTNVPVYVDPGNPANTVLVVGLTDWQRHSLFLIVMLHLIAGYCLGGAVVVSRRQRALRDDPAGVPTTNLVAGITTLRLGRRPPIADAAWAGFFGLGAATAICGTIEATPAAVAAGWLAIAALMAFVWKVSQRRHTWGVYDLHVNEPLRRLILPMTDRCQEPQRVRFADVLNVHVRVVERKDSDDNLMANCRVVLRWTDNGVTRSAKLFEARDLATPTKLAKYLRERVGLTPAPDKS